jgi:IS605 OrfB family transposase
MQSKTKTLKVRVKDKHAKALAQQAASVNFVWNYINELSSRSIKERGRFLSAFDMHKYTVGAGKELELHSQTLQVIAQEYVTRRKQFKKRILSWRKTKGVRRSLGWIPINTGAAKWKNGQVFFNGAYYGVWDSYGLSGYKFLTANFSEDSRGRWYFNVAVKYTPEQSAGTTSCGIDLGCKDAATVSDGQKVTGRRYRQLEQKLGIAQRAGKKKRTKAIHAKIANRRKNDLHQLSRKLVNQNAAIFVGNVSSSKLIKTKMAKSVLDAGWSMLKTMLEYKSDHAGVVFGEVNEAYTTVTCSVCKNRTGPQGLEGLRIREWTCVECGTLHDRDINSAKNILALGHERLAGGIPAL